MLQDRLVKERLIVIKYCRILEQFTIILSACVSHFFLNLAISPCDNEQMCMVLGTWIIRLENICS